MSVVSTRAPLAPIWMAERDGAAVHVHLRRLDAELAQDGDHLHGEGLVDSKEIHVLQIPATFRATLRTLPPES